MKSSNQFLLWSSGLLATACSLTLSTGCGSTQIVQERQPNETTETLVNLSTPNMTGGPYELVRRLNFIGVPDSLGGRGWGPSRSGDGSWIAILIRDFPIDPLLENEVSCFFESKDRNRIDLLELSAELYAPRYYKAEVMDLFMRAVHEVFPSPPASLLRAIERKQPWNSGGWSLEVRDYKNRTRGYEITLRWEG